MTATQVRVVQTAQGPARAYVEPARGAAATLVLGHGAGGGSEARDLAALAAVLPERGITVVRVDQPWRVAGRRVAAPPPVLDAAWCEVVASLDLNAPLVVGGRSAGARVACRTASVLGARAVVALAFPLHPPGRPERSRAAELAGVEVPILVLQGDRDAFGRPPEFPAGIDVRSVPGADHGMRVASRAVPGQRETLALLADTAATWLLATLSP